MLLKCPFPVIEKHKYSRMEQALRHASLGLTPLIRSRSVRKGDGEKSSSSPRHNRVRKITDRLDLMHEMVESNHAGELLKTPYLVRQPSKSRPRKALSSPNSPVLATIHEMSTTATKNRMEGDAPFPPVVHQITPTSSFGTVPDSSMSA
jgi:hypothetical protein